MRAMNDVITLLVRGTNYVNAIAQETTIQKTECFARIESVKRSEFYEADRVGVKLALSVYVNYEDFKAAAVVKEGGKKIFPSMVELDSDMYRIYRTYRADDDEIELILQEVE